jgi:RimJ/RimL family protein N-acetyltransferase
MNQNIDAEQLNYPCKGYTHRMMGSRYVLLRNDFLAWSSWERRISNIGSKILITMGGADSDNVALKVITLLQRLDVDGLEAIVVCGINNPHVETVQTACERLAFPIRLLRNAQNMPELMAWADICISAAGITSWELAYMGLPQVILVLAENQRRVADSLAKYHIALNLGWYTEFDDDDFLVRLRNLIFNPERRNAMSKNGRKIIDGKGADRVLSKMANLTPPPLSTSHLGLRHASIDDAMLLWEWVNDPIVRSNSFNSQDISIENHIDWYRKKLASEDTVIYILEMDKIPVAQIRYDCGKNECATISFSVASRYRGCGLGEQTLLMSAKRACRELGVKKLNGAVLDDNEASKRTFIKAGFRRIGLKNISDKVSHIFLWECPE